MREERIAVITAVIIAVIGILIPNAIPQDDKPIYIYGKREKKNEMKR